MSERAIGMVRSAGAPARRTSEISRSSSATTISVEWSGRADACRAVGVGVVGGAGHGRGEHEQDRRHERDICGGGLVQEVQDDDQQERADRDVRCGRVEWVARARSPLRKSLSGRMGRKRALSQRWLNSPSGVAHPSCAAMSRAIRRPISIPPGRVYPQSVHSGVKFGDNFPALCCKFVDKPVVATRAPTVHFVLPEGAD